MTEWPPGALKSKTALKRVEKVYGVAYGRITKYNTGVVKPRDDEFWLDTNAHYNLVYFHLEKPFEDADGYLFTNYLHAYAYSLKSAPVKKRNMAINSD